MDRLDQIMLRIAAHVTITSIKHECANSIYVDFGVPQSPRLLREQPWSRLRQWMIDEGRFFEIHNYQKLHLDMIPETLNANEIAEWLSEELARQGKQVLLRKWYAPMRFHEIEYDALR